MENAGPVLEITSEFNETSGDEEMSTLVSMAVFG